MKDQVLGQLLHNGEQIGIAALIDADAGRIQGRQSPGLLAGAVEPGLQVGGLPARHVSSPSECGCW